MQNRALVPTEFPLAGRVIRYTLRYSSRARWVSGCIRPETGLIVSIPSQATPRQAEEFLVKHQDWVVRQLDLWTEKWANLPKPWPYGPKLMVRGEEYEVVMRRERHGGVEPMPGRRLLVLAPSAGIPGAKRVLQRWLKQEAAAEFGRRVEELGAVMGLRAKRLYVRNLRSSWGRCWGGGSLSFNYRLIMAPPHILDYVVVHELAHLKQPNHSPRFWELVAAHFSEYKAARDWLRTFGPCLSV